MDAIQSTIAHSVEILHHFNCPICKKWWSIGDWTPTPSLTCPHCGTWAQVEKKDLVVLPKDVMTFLEDCLHPEQLGYAVTPEVRDRVRVLLGMKRVETKSS